MKRFQARQLQPTPVWLGRLGVELRRLASPLLSGQLKGLFSITFDIPLDPLPAPSAAARDWFYWRRPDEGVVLLGLGRAISVEQQGEQRFSSLGREWEQLQEGWTHLNQGSANPRARAFMGFAFDGESHSSGDWAGFPNTVLVVPQLLLEWRNGHCMLTFTHLRRRAERPEQVIAEWLSALRGAVFGERRVSGPPACRLHTLQELPEPERWQQGVAEAVEAIGSGAMTKVVLAREVQLGFGQAVDHRSLLERLGRDYPGCTLFAVRFDGATLVGATPERLLSINQGEVTSDALAGTLDARQATGTEAMVRHEHRPVVDAILSALAPHCTGLQAGRRPDSLRLQQLSHFYTRVRGRLKPGSEPFALLEALHPTPAVGGLPRPAALQWIREHEGIERGWYTGAVGWLGGAGDAELSVVLRCGLVQGRKARLYAGAGITAVSDPAAELAETRLKLAALLDRLSP